MPHNCLFDLVAHALLRAASALMPTPSLPAAKPGETSGRLTNNTMKCPSSRRLYLRRSLQPSFLNLNLAHLELLNLPSHRHRKHIHKTNELWDLEMRNPPSAMFPNLILRARLFHQDPGRYRFTQLRIRNANHLYVGHLRMRIQKLLHLARIHVFAATNDQILRTPRYAKISVRTHRRQVARVQPSVVVNGALRSLQLLIVAFHHQITSRAQFAQIGRATRLNSSHLGISYAV